MKLANLTDEALREVAMLKTRKGTATSEAKRAAGILYTRNISHGGFGIGTDYYNTDNIDHNILRDRKDFEELNGCSIQEYIEGDKK